MGGNSESYSIKKVNVDYIIFFISSLIPQPLIAYVVMKVLDESWGAFWYAILAINGLQFVLWIVTTLITTIMYKIYFRKRLIENIYFELVRMKFPSDIYHPGKGDSDNYYFEIANDDDIPCNIRLKAAAFYNEFNVANLGILARMRLSESHDEAIARYFNDHPNISVSTYYEDQLVSERLSSVLSGL